MLLYDSRVSGNCYKVRLLFARLGLEYRRREVDVIDRSGRRELLGGLNPAFEQYSHEPYIAVARFWAIAGITAPTAEIAAKQRGGEAALEAMDGHLEEHDFLVGGRYTVADIALYAYTHVAPEGGFQLEPYPAVRAWLRRVATQPGHVPITA